MGPWCCCSWVIKSCPTLCDSMDYRMPGFPVLHYFPEFAQTYVWLMLKLIESVMPSNHLILCHLLILLPSVFASIRVFFSELVLCIQGLEFQLQYQSFQWIFRVDFLYDWLVWSPCCPRDSQESFPAPQLKIINSLTLSLLYGQLSHLYMT